MTDLVEGLRAYVVALTTAPETPQDLRVGKAMSANIMDEAASTIEALSERIAVLEGVSEQAAMALHSFICIIAHRFDGDGTYYWMRDPTHDEAQAAMAATNAVSASLTPDLSQ